MCCGKENKVSVIKNKNVACLLLVFSKLVQHTTDEFLLIQSYQVWFGHVILNVNLCNSYPWFETLLICFMFNAELWEKALRITLLNIVAAKVHWVQASFGEKQMDFFSWIQLVFIHLFLPHFLLFVSLSLPFLLSPPLYSHCFCVAFIFFFFWKGCCTKSVTLQKI